MKFKKIDSGHYRVLINDIMFDILKIRQIWVMVVKFNKFNRSTYCYDTLKECKIYANELYKNFKEVGLC